MPTDAPETMSDEMALVVHEQPKQPSPGGGQPQHPHQAGPSTSQQHQHQPRPARPAGKPYQAVTGRFTTKSQRIRYFLMQKEKLDSILLSLHTGCGVEFCLNMLDEDGTMWVSNSEDAASWNQWTKSKETFPAHITMARWERERDALTASHQQDLGLFTLEQQRTIVATLIATVIPNQETWFPYNKARTQAVAQAFAWWPADVDYQDPQAMNAQELRKVFDAALVGNKQLEHHIKREIGKLGLSSAEHELLHRLVSAGVRDSHDIVVIPPAPGSAGPHGLRAVDQLDQHMQDLSGWPSVDYPPSFGGGIAEPEVEVGPDDKLYLGAGPTNSESIKRCIESHGIGFLKKKMVCVKIAGTEVGLAHFYNAVLAMGGIHQVRGKIDQERALARELLISPQASKNWRKLMWEAWDRVFPKITHADDSPKPPGPLLLSDVTARPNTADTLAALAALPAPEAHELEMTHSTSQAGVVRPSSLSSQATAAAMALLRAALPGMGGQAVRPNPRSQPGSPSHGGSGSPQRGQGAPAEDAAAAAELVLQAAAAAAATQNPGMSGQPQQQMLTAAALVATEALMASGIDVATAERIVAASAVSQSAAAVVQAAEAAAKAGEAHGGHDHEAAVAAAAAAHQHHQEQQHHQHYQHEQHQHDHDHEQAHHQHQHHQHDHDHQQEHQEQQHHHHHQQHVEEEEQHRQQQQQHAAAVAAAVAEAHHAVAVAAAAEQAAQAALQEQHHQQQQHAAQVEAEAQAQAHQQAQQQQQQDEEEAHHHHHHHHHHPHHHQGEGSLEEADNNGPAPRRSARNEGKENPLLAAVVPKKRNRMEAEAAAAAKRGRPDEDE